MNKMLPKELKARLVELEEEMEKCQDSYEKSLYMARCNNLKKLLAKSETPMELKCFLYNWEENLKVWYIVHYEKYIEEIEATKSLPYKERCEVLSKYSRDSLLQNMKKESTEKERLQVLESTVEKKRQHKLFDITNRVNREIGVILDFTNISLGKRSGEISGVIKGEKGDVTIETISTKIWEDKPCDFKVVIKKI